MTALTLSAPGLARCVPAGEPMRPAPVERGLTPPDSAAARLLGVVESPTAAESEAKRGEPRPSSPSSLSLPPPLDESAPPLLTLLTPDMISSASSLPPSPSPSLAMPVASAWSRLRLLLMPPLG